MRSLRRLLGIAALIVLVMSPAAACDSDKAQAKPAGSGPPSDLSTKGAEAGNGTGDGKVTKVGKRYVIRPDSRTKAIISLDSYKVLPADTSDSFPPDSGTFTVFTLRIKAIKGPVHYNPLYLRLKTPDGKTVKNLDGKASYITVDNDVKPGDIATGKTIRASIVLDAKVKPGSKLLYTSVLDQVVATWRL